MAVLVKPQGLHVGRYLLERRLATGGMGEVFEAVQLGEGDYRKPVALKLLLPHLAQDPGSLRMFLDEAKLAARLHHPNVVVIHDVGQDDRRYYLAMELVRGVTLSRLITQAKDQNRPLSPELVAYIGRGLCAGLAHAHALKDEKGVWLELVHRDVSPQNLLVSVNGEVKLTDFGIAKAVNTAGRTQDGHLKGKFEYLAPEQVAGAPADQRADVYAAGLTLYHLATGVSPHRRPTEGATLMAVQNGDVPPIATLRPDFPPELCQAIDGALARSLDARLASAEAFERALGRGDDRACAKALGALVEACVPEVDAEALPATASLIDPRSALSNSGGQIRLTPAVAPPAPARRRWPYVLAAALVGVGGLALGVWWGPMPGPGPVTPPPRVDLVPDAPLDAGVALVEPDDEPLPPEPDAGPSATPRLRPAFLTIDAQPWGVVFLDKRRIGDTPRHRQPVPPGVYELEVRNPDSGKRARQRVRLVAGKETKLRLSLR